MNVSTHENMRPLTPQVFHILLALSRRNLHGYALRQEMSIDSRGLIKMGSGSMSNTLRRLSEWGWIEPEDRLGEYGKEARQQYYELTSVGRAILAAEVDRYRHLVDLAETKNSPG